MENWYWYSWYKVTFGPKDLNLGGKARSLRRLFEQVFIAKHAPRDAAMFTNCDDNVEIYCYYFSPGAVAIAKRLIENHDGVTCLPPKRNEVALVVGHADSCERLLSECGSC